MHDVALMYAVLRNVSQLMRTRGYIVDDEPVTLMARNSFEWRFMHKDDVTRQIYIAFCYDEKNVLGLDTMRLFVERAQRVKATHVFAIIRQSLSPQTRRYLHHLKRPYVEVFHEEELKGDPLNHHSQGNTICLMTAAQFVALRGASMHKSLPRIHAHDMVARLVGARLNDVVLVSRLNGGATPLGVDSPGVCMRRVDTGDPQAGTRKRKSTNSESAEQKRAARDGDGDD
jgi:hypothetical protein